MSEGDLRKRVPKACDRCRIKKIKCTGELPCPRCNADDSVCQFGVRRNSNDKPISHSYVNQLEVQQKILIQALKMVWKQYGPGAVTPEEDPSVHDIVSQLGILNSRRGGNSSKHNASNSTTTFSFDEDLCYARDEMSPDPLRDDSRSTSPFATHSLVPSSPEIYDQNYVLGSASSQHHAMPSHGEHMELGGMMLSTAGGSLLPQPQPSQYTPLSNHRGSGHGGSSRDIRGGNSQRSLAHQQPMLYTSDHGQAAGSQAKQTSPTETQRRQFENMALNQQYQQQSQQPIDVLWADYMVDGSDVRYQQWGAQQ